MNTIKSSAILCAILFVSMSIGCFSLEIPPQCGDGVRSLEEGCDGNDLGGRTCVSEGFLRGELACDPMTCQIDTTRCTSTVAAECGDGHRAGGEECDNMDVGGATCADGTARRCRSDCTFEACTTLDNSLPSHPSCDSDRIAFPGNDHHSAGCYTDCTATLACPENHMCAFYDDRSICVPGQSNVPTNSCVMSPMFGCDSDKACPDNRFTGASGQCLEHSTGNVICDTALVLQLTRNLNEPAIFQAIEEMPYCLPDTIRSFDTEEPSCIVDPNTYSIGFCADGAGIEILWSEDEQTIQNKFSGYTSNLIWVLRKSN